MITTPEDFLTEAVIVTSPADTGVTNPPASTFAIPLSDELHSTFPRVRFTSESKYGELPTALYTRVSDIYVPLALACTLPT